MTTHPSICRFCHAGCAILVDVEDGRAVRVTGDHSNPVYSGYSCAKGRQLPRQHSHEDRLLHSVKRGPAGNYLPIASGQVMDEIAERVRAIVDEHGPRSVALYIGTYSGPYLASAPAAVGWLLGLGSRMVFTAATIDQPGKSIANALHGRWLAGGYMFDEGDSWLLVGTNPIVSMSGGISAANPGRRMREARTRGQKLIVIDPRRSEVARFADVFLQPRPGEDPTLLAAMLHVIVKQELYDRTFVAAHATGFETLSLAVEGFDPGYAAERAGVPAADIERAARMFAAGRRGGAVAGTGPNFAGRGNLTEYLLLCLNTLCGYWRREGEPVPNAGALLPAAIPVAQAQPAKRGWGFGEKLRVRGFASSAAGLPTAALAEEILLEGEGRIRALFCIGSNPVAAWPDQRLAVQAIQKLDLCVTLDVKMSATSRHADYVIAPKLSFEVPGVSLQMEALEQTYVSMGYPSAYAQYAPALVDPPEGSDVIEEWEFFYGLAQRMGQGIRLHPLRPEAGALRESRSPVNLDMLNKPTSDELLTLLTEGSRIPLAEIKQHPHGAVFDDEPVSTAAQQAGWEGRLELADPTMISELADVHAETIDRAAEEAVHPFRLVSRRLPNVYNSSGRDLPSFTRRGSYNPAFMHPEDLVALGVTPGEVVRISSQRGAILGVVEAAPELRRGLVSMSHAFGDATDRDADFMKNGSNTGRLVDAARDCDPYSGIPRMSAIPVAVERFDQESEP